jgi:hypothetical protein
VSAEALKLRPLVCEAQAVLTSALVQLGSLGEAVEVGRECVVRARTLHLPVHEAVGRRALGVAIVHAGDRSQGLKHLEAAAAVFQRIGALTESARTVQAIAELTPSET